MFVRWLSLFQILFNFIVYVATCLDKWITGMSKLAIEIQDWGIVYLPFIVWQLSFHTFLCV